jgi:hypothetical protein
MLRDATGKTWLIPPELKVLAALSHQWQSCSTLVARGFPAWQVERLSRAGLVDIGHGAYCVSRRARRYYEEQCPRQAAARPLADWLVAPTPQVMWLGLPYTNLARLGHSTAVGLADILMAANPEVVPVFGVLPEQAPSPASSAELQELVGLADLLEVRLGVIGGDHRATWSLLTVIKSALPGRGVQYIHVDAHHDLYGYRRDRPPRHINHANFLADLMQRQCVDHAVLIGCRDRDDALRAACADSLRISRPASVKAWRPQDWSDTAHTHLSVDLDVLDPSHAPAVSSPLGAGWDPKMLMCALDQIMSATQVNSCSVVECGGGDHGTTATALAVIEKLGK